jgi:hypothetical protein
MNGGDIDLIDQSAHDSEHLIIAAHLATTSSAVRLDLKSTVEISPG